MSEISAVFHTDTEMVLNTLKKRGIDVSICVICGGKIESAERPPRYLSERWAAWRYGKKFYEWNIDAFLPDGVVCNRRGCFVKSLYRDRNKSIESDKLGSEEKP